jgi:hypothetical protein
MYPLPQPDPMIAFVRARILEDGGMSAEALLPMLDATDAENDDETYPGMRWAISYLVPAWREHPDCDKYWLPPGVR